MWLGGKESSSKRDKMVDSVMGVRRPTFKRPYNPTKLNGNYLYHSISMMMVSHVTCHALSCDYHVILILEHCRTCEYHVSIM